DGLPALEKALTAEKLDECLGKAQSVLVRLTLPRFSMASRTSLIEPLQGLGMKLAFQEGNRFPGVNGDIPLHLNRVMQQAKVLVAEEGAEASAVIAAKMKDKGPKPPEPVIFRADHPFLFLIQHGGTTLFLGRVSNPKG